MPLSENEKADLVAYLDGELDDAAAHAIEAKIATDPETRTEVDALKQAWGMLDYLPKASPSVNFTNRTMERLTLERTSRARTSTAARWPGRIAWAAAILVAFGAGYYAASRFWLAPPDRNPDPTDDQRFIDNLRIAEKWRYYVHTDDLDFVKTLNHPDLFGEEFD